MKRKSWYLNIFFWLGLLQAPNAQHTDSLSGDRGRDDQARDIRHRKWWGWLLLSVIVFLFSIFWLALSLCLDFQDHGARDAVFWFQRSGAILVFSSLFLLWRSSIVISEMADFRTGDFCFTEKTRPFISILHICAQLGSLIGTVIWAYGDLLF